MVPENLSRELHMATHELAEIWNIKEWLQNKDFSFLGRLNKKKKERKMFFCEMRYKYFYLIKALLELHSSKALNPFHFTKNYNSTVFFKVDASQVVTDSYLNWYFDFCDRAFHLCVSVISNRNKGNILHVWNEVFRCLSSLVKYTAARNKTTLKCRGKSKTPLPSCLHQKLCGMRGKEVSIELQRREHFRESNYLPEWLVNPIRLSALLDTPTPQTPTLCALVGPIRGKKGTAFWL